jgi:hypothetical protein
MSVNKALIPFAVIIGILAVILFAVPTYAKPSGAPGEGIIESLTAQGASDPGNPIHIESTVRAIKKVQSSNLYYEVYCCSPDYLTLTDSRMTTPPSLQADETYDDSWDANSPETGTYKVTLCWSTGSSQNCNIDYVDTTIWSVPTIGTGLSLFGVLLISYWIWQKFREFQESFE